MAGPSSQRVTPYTAEEMERLLVAGAEQIGTCTVRAAVHLLVFTELVHHGAFAQLVDVEEVPVQVGGPVLAAFVRDWSGLTSDRVSGRMGSAGQRLLALAASLAVGEPINVRENVVGLGHAHARRVVEAFAIATGAGPGPGPHRRGGEPAMSSWPCAVGPEAAEEDGRV